MVIRLLIPPVVGELAAALLLPLVPGLVRPVAATAVVVEVGVPVLALQRMALVRQQRQEVPAKQLRQEVRLLSRLAVLAIQPRKLVLRVELPRQGALAISVLQLLKELQCFSP